VWHPVYFERSSQRRDRLEAYPTLANVRTVEFHLNGKKVRQSSDSCPFVDPRHWLRLCSNGQQYAAPLGL